MPSCDPHVSCSLSCTTIRMHGLFCLCVSPWTRHGQYLTPGAGTGVQCVSQFTRTTAQLCGRSQQRVLSPLFASPELQFAIRRGDSHSMFSLRLPRSKLAPHMRISEVRVWTAEP
jgi:hypothetical protein